MRLQNLIFKVEHGILLDKWFIDFAFNNGRQVGRAAGIIFIIKGLKICGLESMYQVFTVSTCSDESDLCLVLIGGALVLRMLTGLVRTDRKSLSLLFLRDPCRESHPSTSPRKLRLSLFWKYPMMEGLFLCSVARPVTIYLHFLTLY